MSKAVPFQTIQFNISMQFKSQKVLFQTFLISISSEFSFIWAIDRTLSGATTLGLSEPGSDGNKGVLRLPQSSSITGTSPSDCLVSYPLVGWGEFHPPAEKQSVYSTAPADWAITKAYNY